MAHNHPLLVWDLETSGDILINDTHPSIRAHLLLQTAWE